MNVYESIFMNVSKIFLDNSVDKGVFLFCFVAFNTHTLILHSNIHFNEKDMENIFCLLWKFLFDRFLLFDDGSNGISLA